MRKLSIILLSALFVLGLAIQARAEQSATSYTDGAGQNYFDQQVFVVAYNYSTSEVSANSIMILDTTNSTAGTTLGTYINTTTTADDYRVFGVTDQTISASSSGRVCVRGPHKVYWVTASPGAGLVAAASSTAGVATTYSTADGTTGGYLGHTIGNATSGDNLHLPWVWVNPQIHD